MSETTTQTVTQPPQTKGTDVTTGGNGEGRPVVRKRLRKPRKGRSSRPSVPTDRYSQRLLEWVDDGFSPQAWEAVLQMGTEPEAPLWLRPADLRLDDLEHRMLCLGLAHALVGRKSESPFAEGDELKVGEVFNMLGLAGLQDFHELHRRLGPKSELWLQGLLKPARNDWTEAPGSLQTFANLGVQVPLGALPRLIGAEVQPKGIGGPTLKDLCLDEACRKRVEAFLKTPPAFGESFYVALEGRSGAGRKSLARAMMAALGGSLVTDGDEAGPGAALVLEVNPRFDADDFRRSAGRATWVFLVAAPGGFPEALLERVQFRIELAQPAGEAMAAFWRTACAAEDWPEEGLDWAVLARQDLTPGEVIAFLKKAVRERGWGEERRLLDLLLERRAPESKGILGADWTQPAATRAELILPDALGRAFDEIVAELKLGGGARQAWGLEGSIFGPGGTALLFHGPSGTGKSLAAEVLAAETGMPLGRIETTDLESPYVGKSEENLHRMFVEARSRKGVLLLDEADTFLGDRRGIAGSAAKYHSNMTNAFLRELDQFTGVLVFTTNLADTLDPAVERRIRFRLAFPAPGPADRLRIWRSFWREGIPREGPIDLERLSREFSFPGGRIRNAFLAAVSKALRHGAMRQEHLQEACSEEDQRGIGGNRNLKVIRGFSPES